MLPCPEPGTPQYKTFQRTVDHLSSTNFDAVLSVALPSLSLAHQLFSEDYSILSYALFPLQPFHVFIVSDMSLQTFLNIRPITSLHDRITDLTAQFRYHAPTTNWYCTSLEFNLESLIFNLTHSFGFVPLTPHDYHLIPPPPSPVFTDFPPTHHSDMDPSDLQPNDDYLAEKSSNLKSKRCKGKKRTIYHEYSSLVSSISHEDPAYTGDLQLDMEFFRAFLLDRHYAPGVILNFPLQYSQSMFSYWMEGHGLPNYHAAMRAFKAQASFCHPFFSPSNPVPSNPLPSRIRRKLLKAYPILFPDDELSLVLKTMFRHTSDMFTKAVQDAFDGMNFDSAAPKVKQLISDNVSPKLAQDLGKSFGAGMLNGIGSSFVSLFDRIWDSVSKTASRFIEFIKEYACIIVFIVVSLLLFFFGVFGVLSAFPSIFSMAPVAVATHMSDMDSVPFSLLNWLAAKLTAGAAGVSKFTSSLQFKALPMLKDCTTIMCFFEKLPKFLEFVTNIVKSIIDWGWQFIFQSPFFESTKHAQLFSDCFTSVISFVDRPIDQIPMHEKADYCSKYTQLASLQTSVWKMGQKDLYATASRVLASRKDLYSTFEAQIKAGVRRQEPTAFVLTGTAGTGKSEMAMNLFHGVFLKLHSLTTPLAHRCTMRFPDHVWSDSQVGLHSVQDAYWSNYQGNFAFILDDFFQFTSQEATDMEAQTFIYAKGTNPFALPMAELKDKGNAFFKSTLIGLTTNIGEQEWANNTKGVCNNEALNRRRDFVVTVSGDTNPEAYGTILQYKYTNFLISKFDHATRKHLPAESFSGVDGFVKLVDMITDRYLFYFQQFERGSVSFDFGDMLKTSDATSTASTSTTSTQPQPSSPAPVPGTVLDWFQTLSKSDWFSSGPPEKKPSMFEEVFRDPYAPSSASKAQPDLEKGLKGISIPPAPSSTSSSTSTTTFTTPDYGTGVFPTHSSQMFGIKTARSTLATTRSYLGSAFTSFIDSLNYTKNAAEPFLHGVANGIIPIVPLLTPIIQQEVGQQGLVENKATSNKKFVALTLSESLSLPALAVQDYCMSYSDFKTALLGRAHDHPQKDMIYHWVKLWYKMFFPEQFNQIIQWEHQQQTFLPISVDQVDYRILLDRLVIAPVSPRPSVFPMLGVSFPYQQVEDLGYCTRYIAETYPQSVAYSSSRGIPTYHDVLVMVRDFGYTILPDTIRHKAMLYDVLAAPHNTPVAPPNDFPATNAGTFTGGIIGGLVLVTLIALFIALIGKIIDAALYLLRFAGLISSDRHDSFTSDSIDLAQLRTRERLLTSLKANPAKVAPLPTHVSQGGQLYADSIAPRVISNTYNCTFHPIDPSKKDVDGWVSWITSTICVMPTHYQILGPFKSFTISPTFSTVRDQETVYWKDIIEVGSLNKDPAIAARSQRRDLTMFFIPGIRPRKDLTRHLPSLNDLSVIRQSHGAQRLEIVEQENPTTALKELSFRPRQMDSDIEVSGWGSVTLPVTTNLKTLVDYISIPGYGGISGDCCLPFISTSESVARGLLGYHVASRNDSKIKESICAPVFREEVEEFIEELNSSPFFTSNISMPTGPYLIPPSCPLVISDPDALEEAFPGVRTFALINYTASWPRRSKLMPTPVQTGTSTLSPPYPTSRRPACLDEEAALKSFRKLDGKHIKSDPSLLKDPDAWKGVFTPAMSKDVCRTISLQEAIEGIPAMGNMHPADLTTGFGHPHALFGIRRSDWVVRESEHENVSCNIPSWYTTDELPTLVPIPSHFEKLTTKKGLWVHPELQWEFYARHYYARHGITCPALYQFNLKDEDRPVQRVIDKETRFFTGGGFGHQLFCRSIFGIFVSYLERTTSGDSKLGINPYGCEWRQLYLHLKQMSENVLSHDVSGWDIRFPVNIFAPGFYENFCLFFTPPPYFRNLLRSLISSTFCVFLIFKNKIVILVQMPSGSWMTSVFNTLQNSAEHRKIWKLVSSEPFDSHNALAVFGDDSNLACRDWTIWNGPTLAALRSFLFNHDCTEQDKSPTLHTYISLKHALFLQRSYKEEKGLVFCPLNPESLESATQWIKKPTDKTVPQQFAVNVHFALREWAYHSQEAFEKHKSLLNPFLCHYNNSLQFLERYDDVLRSHVFTASEPQKVYISSTLSPV